MSRAQAATLVLAASHSRCRWGPLPQPQHRPLQPGPSLHSQQTLQQPQRRQSPGSLRCVAQQQLQLRGNQQRLSARLCAATYLQGRPLPPAAQVEGSQPPWRQRQRTRPPASPQSARLSSSRSMPHTSLQGEAAVALRGPGEKLVSLAYRAGSRGCPFHQLLESLSMDCCLARNTAIRILLYIQVYNHVILVLLVLHLVL
jgi:hypothetical protein